MYFTHNSITPVLIQSVTFQDLYGAGLRLEPQDIFDKTNPLMISIIQSTFKDCTPYVAGFIDVYENSKLQIDTSSFTNLFSIGSGSVVLANYKENTITISNSTFKNNYAILGGVFYAQFSSIIECSNCTFENNFAMRGGVAFMNSNGVLRLTNSTLVGNRALNAIIYISACNADPTILDSVTFT